jgi:hypothetical protein
MMIWIWMFIVSCTRPTDDYTVSLHGAGTDLGQIEAAPSPMGGRVEVARYRLWGSNLGLGVTHLYGDAPRADGTQFVVGSASFGYPASPAYDRVSAFLSPGPTATDTCVVRPPSDIRAGPVEMVDVGDAVRLSTPGQTMVSLERDPPVHPRPAGESWYVGYGNQLSPVIQGHPDLPDTWTPGADWRLSFPGTVAPPEATFGTIPYPLTDGNMHLPMPLEDAAINGAPVRAPNHGYNRAGEWTGEDDDVRYRGPFTEPMVLTWTPSPSQGDLTVVIHLLGEGVESDCGCTADCEAGFECVDGGCMGVDGASWNVLAEVACTAADDGEFSIEPQALAGVWAQLDWADLAGATVSLARINESTVFVPDVRTWNGKKVGIDPVRVRASDILVTRLEVP